jgi:hypothetical protein
MIYALIENQQVVKYPYGLYDVRKDNPNVSFPRQVTEEIMAAYGALPVLETPKPQVDYLTKNCKEGIPGFVNGSWVQTWNVSDASQEEIAERKQNLIDSITEETQNRLDLFAQTRLYEGILSLCSYQNSPNLKFRTEGQYGVEARDATWSKLYELFDEVLAGTRPIPSGYEDIESELPVLEWPN